MSTWWHTLAWTILAAAAICSEPKSAPKTKPEPKISSIYPAAAQRGTTFQAQLRGTSLAGAQVAFEGEGIEARVLSLEPESPAEPAAKAVLRLQVSVAADASLGRRDFRVVTPRGVSSKVPLDVLTEPVLQETSGHATLRQFPLVINGRIAQPGDTDSYWIEVSAGETLTLEATSFNAAFDPSITISEPSASWFDAHRLNALASNDEPLYFPGLSTDARLVERFSHAGKYCVQVRGFSGQGSADFVYALRILPGVTPEPPLRPKLTGSWEERQFTRSLRADRLTELARRGGASPTTKAVEIFRAVPEGDSQIPVMSIPGVVEGRIARPGETHLIRLRVDGPQSLAIEVDTPEATLPRFNPVVRLLEPGGREIATDVYTKLNNNGLYMMKMIEAKTTVSLNAPGEYTLQIRDITTNGAGADFVYRVMVRPQIPHVGSIEVAEDHINLEPGSSHPLTVTIDREEGFSGYVTVAVEGLPTGVAAVTALENPIEKPPLPNGGKLERYIAKEQRTALMLVAAADAPPTRMPARSRVVVRLGANPSADPILVKEIPVMVVAQEKP
jgi:hypothetical protein